ncbi:MAG: hypothetical protein R3C44_02365 [Chloroflexota bacterium]
MIQITLDKQDDEATVHVEDNTAVIDVQSASGIGGLHAQLTDGDWPEEVLLRLHLRGLERLEIGYDQVLVATGVSSTSDPAPLPAVYNIADTGEAVTIPDAGKDYYPTIHVVPEAGSQPAIPLQNGYFEISLPPNFFTMELNAFTVQWIDFFR